MDASNTEGLIGQPPGRWQREPGQLRRRLAELGSDRRLLRQVLMLGGVSVVVVVGTFVWLMGDRYTGTADAYVRAAQLMVTTDVSGIVAEVDVKEGQRVKAGDVLFRLDPQPFQIALDNANSKLAQAVLDVQVMKEDYARMQHDIEGERAQVDLDQRNFDRSSALVGRGNVSKASYDDVRLSLAVSQRKLQSLEQQAAAQLVKLSGSADIPPADHPEYRQAKSAVDEARRQLEHTTVRAPFDGTVTAVDSLQPGALLISAVSAFATTSAVALVSTHDLWIDAQMKETDLTHVRTGDSVAITIDGYPGRKWKGVVDAVSPATGSAFAVLPAENASGNWVKVVQRIGVRVKLETTPSDPELRVGMSAGVSIDTGHRRWYRILFGDNA